MSNKIQPVRILGSYLSPYVRKVLVTCHIKKIPYQIDPMVPFFGSDSFDKVSVLRSVPVLFDGDLILNDSTVIVQYLEDKYPTPSIFPKNIGARAKARFVEEYFDSYGGNVIVWGLYAEKRIKPFLLKKEVDPKRIEKATEIEIPSILDWVEKQVLETPEMWFGPVLSIAEIAFASLMRNAILSGFKVDSTRFPVASRLLNRCYEDPAFSSIKKYEDVLMKTPPLDYRKVLGESGAPVTKEAICLGEKVRFGKMSKL